MEYEEIEDGLLEVVEPVTLGLGFKIVYLKSWTKNGRLHLSLTLHKPEGVNLKDCATVHRTIIPRICVHADVTEPHLEIASPGVGRVFKNAREFEIFKGDRVTVLARGKDDWVDGEIVSASKESVVIIIEGEETVFPYGDIVKAKLC